MTEGKRRKCQGAALHGKAGVLIYIRCTAGHEGGLAEVEPAQAALGGLLLKVAACHLAQVAEVGAVERTFHDEVRQCIFPGITYYIGKCAGLPNADAHHGFGSGLRPNLCRQQDTDGQEQDDAGE